MSLKKISVFWLSSWFLLSGFFYFFFHSSDFNLSHTLESPSLKSTFGLFGYDAFGRNLLGLIFQASFLSSLFAFCLSGLACILSLIFGSALALTPRWASTPLEMTLHFFLAFPSLLLSLAFVAVSGPGWGALCFSILMGSLPSLTRLIQGRTQELCIKNYITAAQALGGSSLWIFWKHLLPSLFSLCLIKFPTLFAHALLAEVTLSFLGLGAPIGASTWGSLLYQGKDYLLEAPHISIATGLPLFFTILSLQLLTEER